MKTTLRYIRDNEELTDDGYRFGEAMSQFVDAAAEADYITEDGERLQDAIDSFWELANRHPRIVDEKFDRDDCATIRETVLSLFAPKSGLSDWQKDELVEALECLTKRQLVAAMLQFGTAANEYFRLRWLVAEHGGWRKEARP